MSIIAESAKAASTLEEWCARVNELRAEHGTPIWSEEDPRYAAALAAGAHELRDADAESAARYLAAQYFETVKLPTPPLDVPEWGQIVETTARFDDYAEVWFRSAKIAVGAATCWVEQMLMVLLVDDGDTPAGTVETNPLCLSIQIGDELVDFYSADVLQMKQAGGALLQLALDLEKAGAGR